MPDISDLATSDVVGPSNWGGMAFNADGEISLQNDAGTNAFTIDVNGIAGITIAANEVAVNAGDEFAIYSEGAPGDTNYSRTYFADTGGEIAWTSEKGGTGTYHSLAVDVGNEFRVYRQGSGKFIVTGSYIAPVSAADLDLGSQSANREWRDIFLRPSSSLTPTDNGNLCIEATSNTELTFRYKGSDGTVRSNTLTLA